MMRTMMGLTLEFCLAIGLAAIACTTASAEIDESTVDAGRAIIKGKIDPSHDLVVRVEGGDKPFEWRSSRTGGGEFEVVVESSDKIRLEGGTTGYGFVVTTKILTSSDVTYVPCGGDLAGTFAIRPQADFVTRDGVLTFADVTLKDGKKLPVSLRLAPSRAAVPVRADDAEDKAAEEKAHLDAARQDIDQLQGHWRVISSQVGNEKALEAEFKKRRITFTGDKLIYEHGNEQKEKKEGTFKLDPKTKAFDWIVTTHDVTMLAIYELKGDDLKIGFGNDGPVQVRPKRWEIGKEDVVWLLVLKRQKP